MKIINITWLGENNMLIALYKLFKGHKVWLYLLDIWSGIIHLDFYHQQEAYLSKQSFKILTEQHVAYIIYLFTFGV